MDWPGIPATLGVCRPYLGVGGSRFWGHSAILHLREIESLFALSGPYWGSWDGIEIDPLGRRIDLSTCRLRGVLVLSNMEHPKMFFVGTPAILWVLLQYEVHYLLLLQSPILRWWTAECVDISVFGSGPHLGCFNPIDPSLMVSKPHVSLISPVFVNMHS